MFPKPREILALALLVACVVGPVHGARADASALDYRVRLAAPGAARSIPGWAGELAADIGADFGIELHAALPGSGSGVLAARGAADGALQAAVDALVPWMRVRLDADRADEVLARLRTDPRVDRLEAVPLARTCGLVADDPLLRNQAPWLEQVGVPLAWGLAPDPAEVPCLVAIVDGGTDWLHPDLLANVAVNPDEIPGDGIDQDGNGFVDDVYGWNFANDTPDPAPLSTQDFNARHGTHVAGTVGAVLGNGIGVAGVGANPSLILVNAAHPEIDAGIAYGYEGILYAVSRGAKVINCSWRTLRLIGGQYYDAPYSEFEALVLKLARVSGALVIAAMGNDSAEDLWATPAGYPDAVAVGATDLTEAVPWTLGNRGPWLELYAPGQTIVSTFPRWMPTHLGPYGPLTGTSMATAVATGVAAFVAGQRPDWTAEQLRARLTWSAEAAPALEGHRLVRADLALATSAPPDVAVQLRGVTDQDADGLVEGRETVDVRFSARSMFSSQAGVRIEAQTTDPWLVALIGAIAVPRVPADQDLNISRGLQFWVHPEAPPGHLARVQLRAVSGGVVGPWNSGTIALRPLAASLSNSRLRLTASANAMLGEPSIVVSQEPFDPALARVAESFGFLKRAALMLATGPDRLSHALVPREPGLVVGDFFPLEGGLARQSSAGGDSELVLKYSDRNTSAALGVNVVQRVHLSSRPGTADFVILEYDVVALVSALGGTRWGLAMDWSMPAADPMAEGGGYVDERLVPILDGIRVEAAEAGTGTGVAGVRILAGAQAMGRAAMAVWQLDEEPGWNLPADPSGSPADDALWPLLQPGQQVSLDRTGDRVAVLSGDLGALALDEHARVVLALAIADDAVALDDALERARISWEAGEIGLRPEDLTTGLVRFSQNPFRSSTEASYVLTGPGPVLVQVFDLRGRKVRTLVDEVRGTGVHRVTWDGRDANGASVASGVYLVRLRTPSTVSTQAITRVR